MTSATSRPVKPVAPWMTMSKSLGIGWLRGALRMASSCVWGGFCAHEDCRHAAWWAHRGQLYSPSAWPDLLLQIGKSRTNLRSACPAAVVEGSGLVIGNVAMRSMDWARTCDHGYKSGSAAGNPVEAGPAGAAAALVGAATRLGRCGVARKVKSLLVANAPGFHNPAFPTAIRPAPRKPTPMTPTRRRLALSAFLSLQVPWTPAAAVGASAPATHHLQARLPRALDALHRFLRAARRPATSASPTRPWRMPSGATSAMTACVRSARAAAAGRRRPSPCRCGRHGSRSMDATGRR